MENSAEIVGELQQLSPFLAESRPAMPYAVPKDYFTGFPGKIREIIQDASIAGENKIPESALASAFRVPEGYFESLTDNLLEKIRKQGAEKEELADIAPLLNSIPKTNIYTVPAGYFEQPVMIPRKPRAKLVTMASRWTQYVAAAVIGGIVVTTAFLITDTTGEPEYKKYQRLDLPTELDKMSEHELVNYLVTPETQAPTSTSNTDLVADVKNNIQSLSDEELNQYLKETSDTEPFVPVANN